MLKALKKLYLSNSDPKTEGLLVDEEAKLSSRDERYLKVLNEREQSIQSALITINGKVTVNGREIEHKEEDNGDLIRIALEYKDIKEKGIPEFVKSAIEKDRDFIEKYKRVTAAITCLEQTREFYQLPPQCDSRAVVAEHSRINNDYKTQIDTALLTHGGCKIPFAAIIDGYEAHLKATAPAVTAKLR